MFEPLSLFRVRFRRFREDESGAVTVDWVGLTAIIIGMTLALFAVLQSAYEPNATNIGTELESYSIDTAFD